MPTTPSSLFGVIVIAAIILVFYNWSQSAKWEALLLKKLSDFKLGYIANIRRFWPKQKIHVYDLGLEEMSVKELKGKCLVEVRQFPFHRYPHYVRVLLEYRWKPLLVAMVLKEFGALWYMDASVRWIEDRREIVYQEITCRKYFNVPPDNNFFMNQSASSMECWKPGYMLHLCQRHSIFAATHPGMYDYIPTDLEAIKNTSCCAATVAFVVRTEETIELMKWNVLCALEKNCMAPEGAERLCHFSEDRRSIYANCHRFDQSAINLLLANSYGYNIKRYKSSLGRRGIDIHQKATALLESNFSCTPQNFV